MPELLFLVRVEIDELDAFALDMYYQEATFVLKKVEGFQGSGFYRDAETPGRSLIVFAWDSDAAAEAGAVAMANDSSYAEAHTDSIQPADMLRVRVLESQGVLSRGVSDGNFLSLSTRFAEPGYGAELQDDLSGVFGGLTFLPGFRGSIIGVNDSLPEEIIGIAAWETSSAYEASLPPGQMPYEVRLFNKVG